LEFSARIGWVGGETPNGVSHAAASPTLTYLGARPELMKHIQGSTGGEHPRRQPVEDAVEPKLMFEPRSFSGKLGRKGTMTVTTSGTRNAPLGTKQDMAKNAHKRFGRTTDPRSAVQRPACASTPAAHRVSRRTCRLPIAALALARAMPKKTATPGQGLRLVRGEHVATGPALLSAGRRGRRDRYRENECRGPEDAVLTAISNAGEGSPGRHADEADRQRSSTDDGAEANRTRGGPGPTRQGKSKHIISTAADIYMSGRRAEADPERGDSCAPGERHRVRRYLPPTT